MNTPTTVLRILALTTISLSTFTLLSGCSDTSPSASESREDHDHDDHGHDHDADQATDQAAEQVADITISTPDIYPGILGEIKELPIEGNPTSSLKIHHQHIPTFKTKEGIVNVNSKGIAGMMSMTMPFPIADGVSIEGFNIDDKIRFTFSVDWSGQSKNAWEITMIEKIDPATEIDYTNAIP